MAVFMLNVCKFNSCGLTFKSLGHLIQHIEETHIDYDPHVVERTEKQQPACIPLSYVLRFLTDGTRSRLHASTGHHHHHHHHHHHQHHHQRSVAGATSTTSTATVTTTMTTTTTTMTTTATTTMTTTTTATTTTGSDEADESDNELLSEPSDSNDSWTTLEEFSSDFILRYGSRSSSANVNSLCNKEEKPFACPVPGCKKRYKNVNGIKYHSKNGHKNDGKVRKAFKCPCGKSYKTPYGLKNHMALRHSGSTPQQLQQQLKSATSRQSRLELDSDSSSSRSSLPRMPKVKVPAIQDHGYMKPERFDDCDGLGVLTPASSPKAHTDKYLYSSQAAACSDN